MPTIVRWMASLSVAILLTAHSGTFLSLNRSGLLALALPAPPPPPPPATKNPILNNKNSPSRTPEQVETKSTELFSILAPAPDTVWVTGTTENIYWDSGTDLPDGTTFDVSLIPAITEQDAKTWSKLPANPQALFKTVRPMRRMIDPETHYFDFVVPYHLVPPPLLEEHRQKALKFQAQEAQEAQQKGGDDPKEQKEDKGKKIDDDNNNNNSTAPTTPFRVVITAYEGKTNKKIAEGSVFPVLVQLDEFSSQERVDMIKLVNDEMLNGRPMPTRVLEETEQEDEDDEDDPNQSDVHEDEDEYEGPEFEQGEPLDESAHSHDHDHDGHDDHGEEGEEGEEGEGEDFEHDHDHDHDDGDGSKYADLMITEEELNALPPDDPPPSILHAGALQITWWNNYKVRFFTGSPYVIGWDWSRTLLHPEDRNMEWDPELKTKVPIKAKPSLKKSGPPPPASAKRQDDHPGQEEQGETPSTHDDEEGQQQEKGEGQHAHKHEHHLEPLPTLDEAALPQTWALEDLEQLDGQTNVYIEDVLTGQRYEVAAALQPASVRALYFTPTPHMIGPNAKPTPEGLEPSPNMALAPDEGRILLHARVEMDLYKDGAILRFTGFSKPFYVEQGAL
ncbi:hypothetical protein DFQ26_005574 [Actinomortierella ambigua]|nr:hypothetical protein DFQ26_005574 [Actinomortierella ambigua]